MAAPLANRQAAVLGPRRAVEVPMVEEIAGQGPQVPGPPLKYIPYLLTLGQAFQAGIAFPGEGGPAGKEGVVVNSEQIRANKEMTREDPDVRAQPERRQEA